MKILLTCDPEIPVPPKDYGGIERIVDGLAKGYANDGNEVYLIGHPASGCTHTKKNFAWPALHSGGFKNIFKNAIYLSKVVKKVKPDVVHSFSRLLYGYPLFIKRSVPFVQSYQRKISSKSTSFALKLAGKKLRFTACAAHMIKGLPNQQAFTPVFNFTDTDYFTYDEAIDRTHVMFLGRIENIKGTKEAIDAAIKSNNKIIVAGNIMPGHGAYFENEIKPLLAHPLVEYVGPLSDEKKKYYLQRSKALLFPVKWEEPFGIVMAEALACGTPVIGYNIGSVPEVVKDGMNGFIVNNQFEMVAALNKFNILKNMQIRIDCIERFSLKNTAKKYLDIINQKLLLKID